MPCETCGAATKIVQTPEARETGNFTEEYECANGHKGFVSGREEEPAQNWNRYGAVFES